MSKGKSIAAGGFVQELFQVGLYKRTQGRVTRQVTFVAFALILGLAAWRMIAAGSGASWFNYAEFVLPGVMLVVGFWLSYRVVNLPRFADFLIAVEAEMNKVSWPSRDELVRSSIVVIVVIFSLMFVLFGFDLVWRFLFELMGIIYQAPREIS